LVCAVICLVVLAALVDIFLLLFLLLGAGVDKKGAAPKINFGPFSRILFCEAIDDRLADVLRDFVAHWVVGLFQAFARFDVGDVAQNGLSNVAIHIIEETVHGGFISELFLFDYGANIWAKRETAARHIRAHGLVQLNVTVLALISVQFIQGRQIQTFKAVVVHPIHIHGLRSGKHVMISA
jgi:hypothetical protein